MAVRPARGRVHRTAPPARAAVSGILAFGGSHRGSPARKGAVDSGCRPLHVAGGRLHTPPAQPLGLPEAEKERGPAWAKAALEEAEEEEGEEPLAAARPTAARGAPASAGECVRARGPPGRPAPPPRPPPPRPLPSPGCAPAPRPLRSCPPPAWDPPLFSVPGWSLAWPSQEHLQPKLQPPAGCTSP